MEFPGVIVSSLISSSSSAALLFFPLDPGRPSSSLLNLLYISVG